MSNKIGNINYYSTDFINDFSAIITAGYGYLTL